ncbi:hypothetical protein BB559_004026 [Furculomyces boomerangus]|uniref:Mitochondrial import receptor subunit TOM7 n=2 Tax=Harpellales TaxID=61421 RepID=A0A2T9YH97_9FUNG|nr:hypothetical protein BB559_004026 [Furculomyces boomerangus]PVZ98037.1 hypothetical protein BB558_005954 [Smittium angustum]PVZ98185.1 hypothetical protein BB558_005840 [Smittium angustum]
MNDFAKGVILKSIATGKFIFHWGYIPLIVYIGYKNSNPKPQLIRMISPMA